jgi:hypothetical protein
MRHNDRIYVSKLANVLAGYFSMYGYPDAFLLSVIADAVRNDHWTLAVDALRVFEHDREFHALSAEALNYLSLLLVGEEPDWVSGVYVEDYEFSELQEEEATL